MSGNDQHRELKRLRSQVRQLRRELRNLTPPVEVLLRRRGFTVYKKEPAGDLLLPAGPFRGRFFELLHRYSFRLFLRDAIKHQEHFTVEQLSRYATMRTIRSYIGHLTVMGLVEPHGAAWRLAARPVLSFGPTLEWYVAELLRRTYDAEALWGVKFRRPKVGGDYDVLAKLDGALLYVEVKSSPPKQVHDSEIDAFLDRVEDLGPEIAVFLVDTELRMQDKIVPLFEQAFGRRGREGAAVVRMERELFRAGDRLFIVNAKESLAANIGAVLGRYFRGRSSRRSGGRERGCCSG